MNFAESEADHDLRQQVRDVLGSAAITAETRRLREQPGEQDERPLYRLLGAADLLAVSWPREYGGLGRPSTDTILVVEELMRHGVPDMLYVNGIQTVGQFILTAGSDEQRARLLPPLARGELFASVLYTEPEVGSDLGGLRTTATPVSGGFRLDGTKTYSLKSRFTDIGLCAARTAVGPSKYDGITMFVVDLHAEGASVATMPTMADEQFHEVRLDAVIVPGRDVIGELGDGWALLTQALPLERTGLDYALRAERWYRAAGAELTGADLADEQTGRLGARIEAARLLAWKASAAVAAGRLDSTLTAMAKWYGSELAADVAQWATARGASGGSALLDSAYREAPGLTLSGGTSEMMLQILAGSALATAGWED